LNDLHIHSGKRNKRRFHVGVIISLVFHACLLSLLLVWYVRGPTGGGRELGQVASGSRSTRPALPPARDPGLEVEPGHSAAETVQTRLDEFVVLAENRTEEENREELDRQLAKLTRVSSEESIDELTVHFRKWLGIQGRAGAPAEERDQSEFDFDTAQLLPEGEAALKSLVDRLVIENRNVFIEIQGHTDSTGSEEYNYELGLKRAESVRRHLSLQGVPLHRMSVISYGETEPVADNSTREGRRTNRRVVLLVLE